MFPNRAKMVGLLATSLIFGIGMLVNLDCGIYGSSQNHSGEAFHGWPLVYLHRIPEEFAIESTAISSPWPWPPQATEKRVFSPMNLLTNFIVVMSATMITYMIFHSFGQAFQPSSGVNQHVD